MSHDISCPKCGFKVEIPRRPPGMGSKIDPSAPLNPNEQQLIDALFCFDGPVTIRQILAKLFEKKWDRKGKAWNYHYAQRDMSYTVGRGLVQMERRGASYVYKINRDRQLKLEQPVIARSQDSKN